MDGRKHKSKRSRRIKTPSEIARVSAGLFIQEVARKLGYSSRYLRHLELHGGASLPVAKRLAKLYRCDGNIFIHSPEYFIRLHEVRVQRQSSPDISSFDRNISVRTGQKAAAEPSMPPTAAGVDTSVGHQDRICASRRYKTPKQPILRLLKGRLNNN